MIPIIRAFNESDRGELLALWQECGLVRPVNDPNLDIDRKRANDLDHLLVATEGDTIIGSVMFGYDGHPGWLNYLAVVPHRQGRGVGDLLVAEAERALASLGCAKVNLQVRSANASVLAFYRRLGYETDDVISMGKRLIIDHREDGSAEQ